MEKRGRGGKAPANPAPQQPTPTPRKERRPSMFEKEAVSARAAGSRVPRRPGRRQGLPAAKRALGLGGAAPPAGLRVPE